MAREYTPWASSPAARAVMRANRRRDTSPEMAVRRLVHEAGLRYRVDARPLPDVNRRADLVFARARVAVFIDGCFWHGCRAHGTVTKTNTEYWSEKIERTKVRDEDTDRILTAAGWMTIRVWEHEDPAAAAQAIIDRVRARSR